MSKKAILLGLASTLLLFSIFRTFFVMPVAADPKIIKVPEEYSTIQAAVDAANSGDIIQVASGIYYELVSMNKSVKLVGEGSETTIIDANGTGTVVYVTANNVNISGFTMRSTMGCGECEVLAPGVYLHGVNGCRVRSNVLLNNFYGIVLSSSSNNTISGNLVMDNQYGIDVSSSSNNTIRDNVVASNWVYGIYLFASSGNQIFGNTISYNWMTPITYGLYIGSSSSGNVLYRNNFVDNRNQAYENQTNTWDNGAEGNYWSDYEGEDQNGDGVGDTLLPHQGLDYYPLVEPWSSVRFYNVTWGGVTYCISVLSNSTVASFNFSPELLQVGFNVTGPPGTVGFCNVSIPVGLFGGVFMVRVDGVSVEYVWTWNATHSFLYFSYGHGIHNVCVFDVLGAMRLSWFKVIGDSGFDARVDFNGDDFIDGADLVLLGKNWWQVWLL